MNSRSYTIILVVIFGGCLAAVSYMYSKASDLEQSLTHQKQHKFVEDGGNAQFNAVGVPDKLKGLVLSRHKPIAINKLEDGHYVVKFDKAFFGALSLNNKNNKTLRLKLYETSRENYAALNLVGSGLGEYVGFFESTHNFSELNSMQLISPPGRYRPSEDDLPSGVTSVMPFREVELYNYRGNLTLDDIEQLAVHYPYDEDLFSFESDNVDLDRVIELARHTTVATSYSRLFVDGDRERVPYEADAYIQLLSNAVISNDYAMANYTLRYLLENSTWPTEWQLQTILIAHSYYM